MGYPWAIGDELTALRLRQTGPQVTLKTAGENLAAGDFVYVDASSGDVFKIDPTDHVQRRTLLGAVQEAVLITETAAVQYGGELDVFSGMTPGRIQFLDITTPGGITDGPNAQFVADPFERMGRALTATSMLIDLSMRQKQNEFICSFLDTEEFNFMSGGESSNWPDVIPVVTGGYEAGAGSPLGRVMFNHRMAYGRYVSQNSGSQISVSDDHEHMGVWLDDSTGDVVTLHADRGGSPELTLERYGGTTWSTILDTYDPRSGHGLSSDGTDLFSAWSDGTESFLAKNDFATGVTTGPLSLTTDNTTALTSFYHDIEDKIIVVGMNIASAADDYAWRVDPAGGMTIEATFTAPSLDRLFAMDGTSRRFLMMDEDYVVYLVQANGSVIDTGAGTQQQPGNAIGRPLFSLYAYM